MDARVIGISRRAPAAAEHLEVELADLSRWPQIAQQFDGSSVRGEFSQAVFVHMSRIAEAAGFASDADRGECTAAVLPTLSCRAGAGQAFVSV